MSGLSDREETNVHHVRGRVSNSKVTESNCLPCIVTGQGDRGGDSKLHVRKHLAREIQRYEDSDHWTPFCQPLPQLCLPAGLRLPQSSSRKLTAWMQKAVTCLVEHMMFSNLGNKWKIGRWFQLCWFRICWLDFFFFFSIIWPCLNTSSGAMWTQDTTYLAIFLPVLGSLAEKSWLESLDSLFGLGHWALLLPLSSKPSIFKPSENVTVPFLHIFTQISHQKAIGTKAAWSRENYKAKKAILCIQRKRDHVRNGVLYLKVTVTCLQETWPQSMHLCYLLTSNSA